MNDRMSRKAKAFHITTAGLRCCPFCIASREFIEFREVVATERGVLLQKARCSSCGRSWVGTFKLVDVKEG